MADRDCAICRGTGKYPASVDITRKLADCPDCTPEPTNLMRAALVAIQELHKPKSHVCECGENHGPYCDHCQVDYPCNTRRLADDALGGDNNG